MDHNNYNNTVYNNRNTAESTQNAAQNNAYGNPFQQPNFQGTGQTGGYQQSGYQQNGYQQNGYQQDGYQSYQRANDVNLAPNGGSGHNRKNSFGAWMGKAVAIALVFGVVAGGVFTGVSYAGSRVLGLNKNTDSSDSGVKITTNAKQTSTGEAKELNDVSGIASEVMPSIVAITNVGTVTYQSFFGTKSYESESAGSGIIISEDDNYFYVVSNNHVVANAESLTVQFCDDATVSAEVTGTDPADDLAVVQIEKKSIKDETLEKIKVATVGDSKAVNVGEPTIAIGNALGYGQSVTTGIISALGRTVSTQDETTGETITNTNLIQTDAAINPGNSGGALLNVNGQVIGINSVKYSDTAVEGIGYAIPMSVASPIIEKLINHEPIAQTAYLGIMGQDVSSDVANVYNMPEGVYISEVVKDSAAEKAGLRQGDIITALDGTKLTSMSELRSLLAGYKEGDKVEVKISRISNNGYEETTVEVTLGGQSTVR